MKIFFYDKILLILCQNRLNPRDGGVSLLPPKLNEKLLSCVLSIPPNKDIIDPDESPPSWFSDDENKDMKELPPCSPLCDWSWDGLAASPNSDMIEEPPPPKLKPEFDDPRSVKQYVSLSLECLS